MARRAKEQPNRIHVNAGSSQECRLTDRAGPAPAWHWYILGGIIVVGALLRIGLLAEVRDAPDYHSPIADALFHDYWARGIVTNDWSPPIGTDDPRIAEVPYLRPPGYTWFLAGVYSVFGSDPLWPRVVQSILGLCTAVMGYWLGRLLFSSHVGLWSAGIIATYWLFLHYETELQEPALFSAMSMGLMLLLVNWYRKPHWTLAILSGVMAGALALTRANVLLFLPVVAMWMAWHGWRQIERRQATWHIAAFVLSAGAMIVPVTIRNYVVSKEWVLIACNGPVNFYIGNNPDSDGYSFVVPEFRSISGLTSWGWFSYDRVIRGLEAQTGRPMTYGDASEYFNARAWEFIRTHPGRFAALCFKRAALFWGPAEIANNKVERLERAHSAVLRYLPNYSLLLSLSIVGIAICVARRWVLRMASTPFMAGGVALVALFVIVYFISFVPFLVATRFRAPLLPLVFIFAAVALDGMVTWLRMRQWMAGVTAASTVAILAIGFMAIASATDADLRDVPRWHTDRGAAFATANRHEDAIREFRAALIVNPQFVSAYPLWCASELALGKVDRAVEAANQLKINRPDRDDISSSMAARLADYGARQLRARKPDTAFAVLQAAVAMDPSHPEFVCNLGISLAMQGRHAEAVPYYRTAIDLDPEIPEAWFHLGVALHQRGDLTGAMNAYQKSIEINPRLDDAWVNFGRIDASQGRLDAARVKFEQALSINPANTTADDGLRQLEELRRRGTP